MEGQEFLEWMGRQRSPRCAFTGHELLVTYDRPIRQLWRKRRILSCSECNARLQEPCSLWRGFWTVLMGRTAEPVTGIMSPPARRGSW